MKKFFTTLFVVLIVAFAVFSFFRYFYLLKMNYSLELKLRDVNDRIIELENTKKNLEQILEKKKEEYLQILKEKEFLKGKLKDTEKQLNQKAVELENIKAEFKLAKLKLESINNDYLQLKEDIEQLKQERDVLQSKFTSLPELKKAYAILKKKLRKAQLEQKNIGADRDLQSGNRGYLLWQGESTFSKKVKIKITPVFK
jgi:chromosome segregation ATPase